MADQDDPELQRSLATTLPPPPPFYKDFTPEKLARFEEIIEAETYVDEYGCRVPSRVRLPPELVNLQPPPEPNDGVWRCFGDRFTVRAALG